MSFPATIASLDAALAGFMPKATGDDLDELRTIMLANNDFVMKEMERRSLLPKTLNGLLTLITTA